MEKLKEVSSGDRLIQHGAMLMAASIISHVCNIVFQMVMGRALSGNEYALLCTLLGFANLVILPLGAMSAAVNYSTSLLKKEGRAGDITRLIRRWLVRVGGVGLGIFILCLLFASPIAAAVHLDRKAPVMIMGFVLFLLFSSSVIGGAANGLQMFGVVTAGIQASSILKLVAGGILVHSFAAAAGWGLLGHGIGLSANLAIMFVFLWKRLHGRSKTSMPIPKIGSYVGYSFVALMAFGILFRADMILVKHYLPDTAATFAYATTIGHIVIFLPLPLAKVMFPKVVSQGSTTQEHQMVLMKSLLYTAICVVPVAIGCSLFAWIPLRILFGMQEPSHELILLVGAMGWVMLPVALINIILFFQLAQKKFVQTLPVVLCAILYLVGAALWHGSLWSIVAVAGVSTWGCLLLSSATVFSSGWKNKTSNGMG